MSKNRESFRLCCFLWLLLTGILSLLLFHESWASVASAEEPATIEKPRDTERKSSRYQFKEDHHPDGIGKFYMGREIAHVMGFQAAIWLERSEREEEERLSLLVRELKLKPGDVVADIGAGSGVITLMMAREVGDTGKVLAVDIQPEMLELLGDKIENLGIKNVERVLATKKSPKLKPESIDFAPMVDVYHEFEFPHETMLALSKALKPGGRVAFVEYRFEDPEVPIKLLHKMSEEQIKKEIGLPEFGLEWKETVPTLPRQHIVVFERPSAESRFVTPCGGPM